MEESLLRFLAVPLFIPIITGNCYKEITLSLGEGVLGLRLYIVPSPLALCYLLIPREEDLGS